MYFTITAPVEYKICKLYAEKSASLSMLKCANYFRRIILVVFQLPCVCKSFVGLNSINHRVHRVATAAFWRTFSHEGKISPGW